MLKDESTGNQKLNKESGMLTLELLLAFALLTITVSAVILVVFGNQSIRIDTQTNNEALYLAQEAIEKARADAALDFNLVNPSSSTNDIYDLDLTVEQVDLWTKKVTSNIDWSAEGGRNPQVQLTTLITNPDAVSGGDTCSSVLEGDWTHPQMTFYELGDDILNDPSSGFPISSIQTFDSKMYITVDNTHGNNNETFFILNISDPENILSNNPSGSIPKLDNNPNTKSGLNAVAVDGEDYAYAANGYGANFSTCPNNGGTNLGCGQLQVITLSPLAVIYTYKVPGVTGDGGQGIGKSIFYKDGVVYLGLANDPVGAEFHVIDVGGGGLGGSPTNPILLDSIEIGNDVNAIYVRNDYAYVASPHTKELRTFDVSTLGSVSEVGYFNSTVGAGNGKSIYLVGNTLYLGKTVPNAGSDFHILNNTNPASTLTEIGPGLDSASSINGILVRSDLAFFITKTEFQTWNISDPLNISPYASPLALPPGSGNVQGSANDCEGNYIFVGSQKTVPGPGGQDKGYISVITGG